MPLTIADAMPRKIYGETTFGERLQNIGTDELPGVRSPRVERVKEKAVIRPIHSLVAVGSSRRNGEQGERHAC